MLFVPRDSSLFRSAIEALKDFLPAAKLYIDKTGVKISGMDVSHVGFVDYFLAAADCESLDLAGGAVDSFQIGLNLAVLARVLNPVSGGDKISLALGKKGDSLIVSYVNDKIAKKSTYELPLLDINGDALEIPEVSYDATVKARTSDIHTLVKEIAHFGDTARFKLDEDGFHISTEGDSGKVNLVLENTDDREMMMEGTSVEGLFAMKYVSNILKSGAPLASNIELEFDSAHPLRAAFKFGASSHFVAYLAPKLSE